MAALHDHVCGLCWSSSQASSKQADNMQSSVPACQHRVDVTKTSCCKPLLPRDCPEHSRRRTGPVHVTTLHLVCSGFCDLLRLANVVALQLAMHECTGRWCVCIGTERLINAKEKLDKLGFRAIPGNIVAEGDASSKLPHLVDRLDLRYTCPSIH